MTKQIKLLLLAFCISTALSAQVTEGEKKLRTVAADTLEGWQTGGLFAFSLSQTSLSNWAAGGNSSVAVNGIVSLYARHKKGKGVWENYLDLGYGLLKEGKEKFRKTDDKIDLLSKYGNRAYRHWYYSALVNFKTQMAPGYLFPKDSVISEFLAPAYNLTAIGMDYKPDDYLSMFIAPLTSKLTIVNNDVLAAAGAFGVDPGKKTRHEIGGYLRFLYSRKDFTSEALKNVSIITKLDLFSNYRVKPGNVDVSWETLIGMKVNKFLTVNLNTHLIYDDDVKIEFEPGKRGARTQFKEIFGLGASLRF
jgi:hypothetical protein